MSESDDLDLEKIDNDVLAILFLTAFRERKDQIWQAWKGHDWDVLERLHTKGLIFDPKNKNKSLSFTEEGIAEARRLFEEKYRKGS